MQYSLSNRLSSNVSGIDPDARAYIAAVEAVLPGNSIETALPNASNPKRIISDFIKAEKGASRWALHKRIYLPIYNNAAASAVDMVSRTSGTFFGGVTHAAGYVQGDGSSGYFLTNGNASSHITENNLFIGTLHNIQTTLIFRATIGVGSGTTNIALQSGSAATVNVGIGVGTATAAASGFVGSTGIISVAFDGSTRRLKRRTSSSNALLASNTIASAGLAPAFPFAIMARNNGLVFDIYSNAGIGASWISDDGGDTQNDLFTANLKTLWESLTGLTLP